MSNAHLPSPTKKPSLGAPRPAAPDPTDIRGSMSKQARTGFEDSVAWRATQARAAVAQGHILPHQLNARRPLGKSQTEPVLSFGGVASSSSSFNPDPTASATRFPPFQTHQEIMNLVYTDGKRPNELRPFGETGTTTMTTDGPGGFGRPRPNDAMRPSDNDDGGDGFDLDEVFGTSGSAATTKSTRFDLPPPSSSSPVRGATGTTTHRMKRAYEGEDSAATLVDDDQEDEDMVATDVEDEGVEDGAAPRHSAAAMAAPSSMFGGPSAPPVERRISGQKRAFGKTKSLPASAFHSMDF